MEVLHEILISVTEGIILLSEFMGVFVMLVTGIRGIIGYFRKSPLTRLEMARGMAMALEFLLVGEILHTVTVSNWEEIIKVAGLIVLRVSLTILIHWEIASEKKEFEEEEISKLNVMKENKENTDK
ncbi:MAG: DUF1622 domain-containing protein [Clostridiales bacterium]|nr:DUF1622 domain-containing protein [Clostridiales bacterium]